MNSKKSNLNVHSSKQAIIISLPEFIKQDFDTNKSIYPANSEWIIDNFF
jgi:hypothetical protein